MSCFEVEIPTLVNPHLFWITDLKNTKRSKTLVDLQIQMQNALNNNKQDLDDTFEIGEIVAVKKNNKYFRATIDDIGDETISKNPSKFLCWLFDYGTMYETDEVYKLPRVLKKTPPLALQASLNNCTYVQQKLSYDDMGQAVKINVPVANPTNITRHVVMELLANSENIKFQTEDKFDGILLGDLLYEQNKEVKSLKQSLFDKGILMVNEELFQEIKNNINDYRASNLPLLHQVCNLKNPKDVVEEHSFVAASKKIICSYLSEFEQSDDEDEKELLLPSNRKKLSKISSLSSENCPSPLNNVRSDDEVTNTANNLPQKQKTVNSDDILGANRENQLQKSNDNLDSDPSKVILSYVKVNGITKNNCSEGNEGSDTSEKVLSRPERLRQYLIAKKQEKTAVKEENSKLSKIGMLKKFLKNKKKP